MSIKIFTKHDCPRCPHAKKLANDLIAEGYKVEEWDVDTREGLAEATYYSVRATPSIIVTDDETDEELASWRGETPSKEEVLKKA
ncbi:MAG: thioredoxin family protein [Candidatus Woesearchaeota archaeon]